MTRIHPTHRGWQRKSRVRSVNGSSKIRRRFLLDDASGVEHGNPVADATDGRHFVRSHDHRHAFVGAFAT